MVERALRDVARLAHSRGGIRKGKNMLDNDNQDSTVERGPVKGKVGGPLISVLVPVYNTEPYLERCVDSILAQTYRNFELVIVDDCSPDGAGALADRLAEGDGRIAVFHHARNTGLSGARNTGLEHSRGEFVTFVDSDDWVEPDYLEYLHGVMEATDAGIGISRHHFTSRYRQQVEDDEIASISPEDFLCGIFYNRINIAVWNKMYRRSVISDKRFILESKTGEGMQFNSRVAPKASRVGVGLRRVYTYNVDNEGSATKKPNVDKQAFGAIETMNAIKGDLSGRSRRLDDAIEYQYFATALYALTHLVRAGAEGEHPEFFDGLKRYVRKTAPKTLRMETTAKQKIKSLIAWFSPMIVVKLGIWWRYRMNVRAHE